jgi:hypothetical protein
MQKKLKFRKDLYCNKSRVWRSGQITLTSKGLQPTPLEDGE